MDRGDGSRDPFVTNVEVYDNPATVAYQKSSNGQGRLGYLLPGEEGEQARFALGDKGGKRRIVDMTKEDREEQEKVWKLALQSIDQARHANAPGHEPNTSKPISGANLGKISQIITQLEYMLAHINENRWRESSSLAPWNHGGQKPSQQPNQSPLI